MPERRTATSSSSSRGTTGVRRNLFHQHLQRRPTTSSTSTSSETLRLDGESEMETPAIIIRDKNGNFEIGDVPVQPFDEDVEDEFHGRLRLEEQERKRLNDAVKRHQNRATRPPSEPAELLDNVKASLRAKTAALAEDNWMYESEEEPVAR